MYIVHSKVINNYVNARLYLWLVLHQALVRPVFQTPNSGEETMHPWVIYFSIVLLTVVLRAFWFYSISDLSRRLFPVLDVANMPWNTWRDEYAKRMLSLLYRTSDDVISTRGVTLLASRSILKLTAREFIQPTGSNNSSTTVFTQTTSRLYDSL